MKAPLSWLKDYVDIDCLAEELKDKLFSCGFEVEEMVYVGKNIDKIVTCKILEIEKHPNADKLSVTKVDAGKYGILQIITNAKNIYVGAIVPVAVDGATLNNGERIFNGELRGISSYGMFCSGEELGINDDWYKGASFNGVLIFEEDFPLGEEVKKLLNIEDVMFDINITANRPDCQSILGIAREIAAILDKPLKMPDLTYKCSADISTKKTIKVNNNAYDLCQRYISHLVKDIKIEESPLWMKRRLFSMGIRSINNIVDITNFILCEIGQPMHAFDLSQLNGNEINIRRANDKEKIITLDNKEFELSNSNLVICDKDRAVALAGIMGGLNSEITNETKNVVFESARFSRDNIRKSSRSLGQKSDSSSRYEKGVDFYSVEIGMKRALNLISTLNCGTIACDEYDLHEEKISNKIIKTTISRVNDVLGIKVETGIIEKILRNLNFGVKIDGDNLEINVPLFREDVESYPDIAEEIIREYGYSHIKPTLLQNSLITNGGLNNDQRSVDKLKSFLVGFGFNETITYSFVPEKDFDIFGLNIPESKRIKILNPISEDMAVMRSSLIPSLVRAVSYNLNRKNLEGRLFEFAKTYFTDKIPLENLPNEVNTLAFTMFGDEDFFSIKGIVENILNSFCFGKDFEYKRSNTIYLHPTRSADIYVNNEYIGSFGQIHPTISEKFDIDKPAFFAEINYDLLKKHLNEKIIFNQISKFPSIERDLAITIDKNVLCGDIIKCIKNYGGEYLNNVSLFDVYEGDQITEGKKSMAFNLIYLSNEKTLGVEEIDNSIKNILSKLKIELGAELR